MRQSFWSIVTMLAFIGCAQASHGDAPPAPEGWLMAERHLRIDREEAALRVQRATGGRILSAEPARMNGREAWRVKALTGRGEVRVFIVDARSGAISAGF